MFECLQTIRRLLVYTPVVWIWAITIHAADFLEFESLKFETLDSSDGLSSSAVSRITQDELGFLWVGTNNGLNRYDGRHFQTFHHNEEDPTSILSDNIVSLYNDSIGRLWIGTRGGVARYVPEDRSFKNYVPNPQPNPNPVTNRITAFSESVDGSLIAAAQDGTLYRYEPDKDKFETTTPAYTRDIRSLLHLPDGRLAIGAEGQLLLHDFQSGQSEVYPLPKAVDDQSAYHYAEAIKLLDANTLLVGTVHRGVLYFDLNRGEFSQYPAIPDNLWISSLNILDDDSLIATTSQGLFVKDSKAETAKRYQYDFYDPQSIASSASNYSFVDRQNNLWIGTDRGLSKATAHKAFSHLGPDLTSVTSLSDTSVSAIYTDHEGNRWIGYFNGQLDILNPQDATPSHSFPFHHENPEAPAKGTIHFIKATRDNTIWVGSFEGGLRRYRPELNSFENVLPAPYHDIRDIEEDAEGNIWIIAHGHGLLRYNPTEGSIRLYENDPQKGDNTLIDNWATCIARSPDGILWIGSGTGLCRFDPIEERFRNFRPESQDPTSLSRVPVYDLLIDDSGKLWVGTLNGINHLDTDTFIFKSYKIADDPTHTLKDSTLVRSIEYGAANEIWFSTDRGLLRLDTEAWTAKIYNRNDGLHSRDFLTRSSHRDQNGRLYFGGINGVTTFEPKQIHDSEYSPAPIITGITNLKNPNWEPDSPPYVQDNELEFTYQNNSFTIDFITLNYNSPDSLNYKYQLVGFDSNWSQPKPNTQATYTNLPPGDYTFTVKAANSDAVWSDTNSSLAFSIVPPFWTTTWFRLAAALTATSLLFGIHRLRIRTIRIQKETLKKTVDSRTHELANANEVLAAQREEIQCQNEELIANKVELETRVETRTKELKIALAEAQRADKLKTSFLENMSHEIRTPMNAIIGFLSVMQQNKHSEKENKEFFRIINSSSDSLLTLIDDILDLSTLESGNATFEPQPVALAPLFSDLEAAHRRLALDTGKTHLSIIFEEPPSDFEKGAVAELDPTRIRQILSNLLSNAAKFTETGTIRFGYKVSIESNDSKRLYCYVSDTGRGIAVDDQERIFERFRKVETDRSRLYRGTGLGLAITKNLVELMGGEIGVSSVLDEGSHFSLWIPFTSSEEEVDKTRALTQIDTNKTEGMRILVAEDEDPNFEYIRMVIQSSSKSIDRANDGAEALSLAKKSVYDVILMDLKMPQLDGLEVTRELRKGGNRTPILVQTAHVRADTQLECLNAGANLVLRKPFSPEELQAAITESMQESDRF